MQPSTTTWRRRGTGAALGVAVLFGVVGVATPTASAQECLASGGTVAVAGGGYACRIFVVPFFPATTSLPAGSPIPDGAVPARLLGPSDPYPAWPSDVELRTVWIQPTPSASITVYAPTDRSRPVVHPTYDPPSAPTGVTAVAGDEQVTLSWAPPANDGGAPIDRYVLTEIEDGVEGSTRYLDDAATSVVWANLTNGHSYAFVVSASNGHEQSVPSLPSTPVVPARLPEAPFGLGLKAENASATVTVFPLTGYYQTGGLPISSYTIRVFRSGTLVRAVTVPGGGGPEGRRVPVSGLVNGGSYSFDVSGTNALGTGPASRRTGPVTPQVPMSPPGAPAIRASLPGPIPGGLAARWTLPKKSDTAPVRYVVVRAYVGAKLVRTSGAIDPTQGIVTFLGLDPRTRYSFTVTTHNEAGASTASKRSVPVKPMPGKVRPR